MRTCLRGAFKIPLKSGFPKACPEAFPLWDPSEPSSPPSCGVCPTSGVERGVAFRLASGRTGRAVGVAWPPAGGAGGFRGHAPGALVQKGRRTAHTYLSPCPLSVGEGVKRRKRRSSSARLSVTWVGRPCGQA